MSDDLDRIDEYILPLLKHLWKNKVITYFSCAGHSEERYKAYLSFKYNRKFINYLWNNNFAIERHYNDYDKRYQYIVRPNLEVSYTKYKRKICRDYFWSILSNYELI